MRVVLKADLLAIVPETEAEATEMENWKAGMTGHVFCVQAHAGSGVSLGDLGLRENACNEPLNITSMSTDPAAQWISNFAETQFELDGQTYRSVESFWQGLKFDTETERR